MMPLLLSEAFPRTLANEAVIQRPPRAGCVGMGFRGGKLSSKFVCTVGCKLNLTHYQRYYFVMGSVTGWRCLLLSSWRPPHQCQFIPVAHVTRAAVRPVAKCPIMCSPQHWLIQK